MIFGHLKLGAFVLKRRNWKGFFIKNGPTPATFCLFSSFLNTIFTEKTVDYSGIRIRIDGVEGEHAHHLTTTKAQKLKMILL